LSFLASTPTVGSAAGPAGPAGTADAHLQLNLPASATTVTWMGAEKIRPVGDAPRWSGDGVAGVGLWRACGRACPQFLDSGVMSPTSDGNSGRPA